MIKGLEYEQTSKFYADLEQLIKSNPEKYKYFSWGAKDTVYNANFEKVEMFSVSSTGEIKGEFGFIYDALNDKVIALELIALNDNCPVFMKDFFLFCKYMDKLYEKIEIQIIPGSPSYSPGVKLFKKFKFEKVGTMKDSIKLQDGRYYDVEIWEKRRVKEV